MQCIAFENTQRASCDNRERPITRFESEVACVSFVRTARAAMSTNFARDISKRLVIEYELVPRSKGKTDLWVVDDNLIETVDGVEFVTMSTACRGMAKAIGADMNLSVPLGQYVYTDTLRELRNGAVTKLMGELEKERNPAYVEGKTKPIRTSMEDELPKVIDVTLPPIGHGGETYGPLNLKLRLHVKSNKAVAVAMTKPFFDYFVAAMHATKQPDDGATPRKRCKRNERVSETTGVSGVRMYGRSGGSKAEPRIGVPYTDDDGIKNTKPLCSVTARRWHPRLPSSKVRCVILLQQQTTRRSPRVKHVSLPTQGTRPRSRQTMSQMMSSARPRSRQPMPQRMGRTIPMMLAPSVTLVQAADPLTGPVFFLA